MRVSEVVVAIALLGGCSFSEQQPPKLRSTARVIQPVSTPSKQTGLDCASEGSSVCLPGPKGERGFCFSYGPGLQSDGGGDQIGYICTHTCETDADCEEELACRAVVAGDTKVCMPHRDFVPKVARTRVNAPRTSAGTQAGKPGGSSTPTFAMDGGSP